MRLKPSPRRHFMLLALFGSFVGLGIFVLRDYSAFGWLTVVFFGLGALVALVALVPGSSYLELSPSGISVRTLYRTWQVNWSDVSGFFVSRIGGRTLVCWNYTSGYSAARRGRDISRNWAGVEASLPGKYGLSAEELVDLLNRWRVEHAGTRPNNSSKPNPLRRSA